MGKEDIAALRLLEKKVLSLAGISLTVRTTLRMLQNLETAYGDGFSVERACEALDSLAKNAGLIKNELRAAQKEAAASIGK